MLAGLQQIRILSRGVCRWFSESHSGLCLRWLVKHFLIIHVRFATQIWIFRVVGTLADMLNHTSDAAYFLGRSENYRNIWNAQRKLMCPRNSSGTSHCPVDPTSLEWIFKSTGYTEGYCSCVAAISQYHWRTVHVGNAEQWRWFVPHNIPGLIHLFGSNESFAEELDIFFERAKKRSNFLPNEYYWWEIGSVQALVIGLYHIRAGNEPDLLAVYLFSYAGRPDLTQKVTS
jgi:putative alpha-1,2-mannosidase